LENVINQSGDLLLEIAASVQRVSDIVGEIAAAPREQSIGIDQVSKAISQIDRVTQQNAAQTAELSSTAQGLSSSVNQLVHSKDLRSLARHVAPTESAVEPDDAGVAAGRNDGFTQF
jgi:methyl-accepting chemotaxis protein